MTIIAVSLKGKAGKSSWLNATQILITKWTATIAMPRSGKPAKKENRHVSFLKPDRVNKDFKTRDKHIIPGFLIILPRTKRGR
jgi:hypothetical protein